MVNPKIIFVGSLFIYIFVFILPVVLYLKTKDKVDVLEFLKLNKNVKQGFAKGVTISILFVIILLIKKNALGLGWRNVNFNIGILWISGFTVGILEEIPFRGFILQKLIKKYNFIKANLITTLLFALVHVPIWGFAGVNILDSFKSLLIIGFILGYLFKESDSLWVPIIFHSVFNLSIWIGIG